MGAGLQIFNDTGFIQIDADYRNMELKQKGTFSIAGSNSASGGTTTSYTYVSYTGSEPVIAISCDAFCYAALSSLNGNTWTFMIYNGETTAISGEYFIFDQPSSAPAGNTGLQVFDGSGALVFDSNKKYMRVIDFFQVAGSGSDETRNYGSKKTAWVMCDFGYRFVVQPSPADPASTTKKFLQSLLHLAKSITGQVRVRDMATYTNAYADSAGQVATSEYPSRWLIIDVTNY